MKTIIQAVGKAIRSIWHAVTIMRHIVANIVFLVLIVVVIAIFISGSIHSRPEKAALRLKPTGKIVEQSAEPLLVDRLFDTAQGAETILRDVIDTINHARSDDNVSLLFLELDSLGPVGLSQLQEIGAALTRFKDSGKTIIASGHRFDQGQYYLAAHADKLYLHPMGQIWLSGFGVYRQFIRRALDKLQIDFHVFIEGTYKSALEPFIRNGMSDADRESNTAWLTTLWENYTSDIAKLRGIPAERIDDYINNIDVNLREADGDTAQMALDFGLVDGLKTGDEVRQELKQIVGEDEDGHDFRSVSFENYTQVALPRSRRIHPDRDAVAVIVAEGIIMDGRQPAGRIGAESMIDLIRQVRDDEQIKAVVLRINSGGGSALASEMIRRELELTRLKGKPVIVSMGSVAASGAYWISVAADEIWASSSTLTGSIGIFAALPTFDRSLDTLGITTDGVGTTRLAGALDVTRPLNPLLFKALELGISQGYRRFIERVGEGRHMSTDKVEEIAQGRVWAAPTAQELGLVDRLGGMAEAVQRAAELAELASYNTVYVERSKTPREKLLRIIKRMVLSVATRGIPPTETSVVGRILAATHGSDIESILQLNDPGRVYAMCLPCIALEY